MKTCNSQNFAQHSATNNRTTFCKIDLPKLKPKLHLSVEITPGQYARAVSGIRENEMVKGYHVEPTLKPRSINYSQPKDKGIKFGYIGSIEQLAKQRLSP